MNRAIAAVYAISIRHSSEAGKPYTDEQKDKLLECIPELVRQVQAYDELRSDPWIKTYLQAKMDAGLVPVDAKWLQDKPTAGQT
jgi:hypothetical protein